VVIVETPAPWAVILFFLQLRALAVAVVVEYLPAQLFPVVLVVVPGQERELTTVLELPARDFVVGPGALPMTLVAAVVALLRLALTA
jgi:hypothetical protein